MSQAMELLEKAYTGETISIIIDLNGVKGVLDYSSSIDMFIEQDKFKTVKRIEYNSQGFGDKPIDEGKWDADLKRAKPEHRERLTKGKPQNATEQLADMDTQFMVVRELVPRYIRWAEDGKGHKRGELMFETKAEQEEMGRFIMNHPQVMNAVISAITELYKKIDEAGQAVKNL